MRELSVIFERGEWRLIVNGITTGRPLLEREARLIAYALNSAFSSSSRADDARDGEREAMLVARAVYKACAKAEFGGDDGFSDWSVDLQQIVTDTLRAAVTSAAPPEVEK